MQPITPTNATCLLVKLSQYCLINITGPDAIKFLQGQVTCDLRELSSPVIRLGAQCNPKGRIIFSFNALQESTDSIFLRIPKTMQTNAIQSLKKYIVFSKAKVNATEDQYYLYGILGKSAAEAINHFFTSLPNEINQWTAQEKSFLVKISNVQFECWIHRDAKDVFLNSLSTTAQPTTINHWALEGIKAGISHVVPSTQELFTPQDLNYQLVNGVSFRKGCYTGQEIIARLHYKGKLKRHLYRFTLASSELPSPGTTLVTREGNTCGHILEAAFATADQVELLASIQAEHINDVFLLGSGEKLQPLELPYAIPTADDASH